MRFMSGSAKASKRRVLIMDREDADALSRTLRDTWPGIRFMPYEYWMRKVDKDGYRTEKQKPPNLKLQYYDSLGDPDERRFQVWVEPEGWKPDWQGPTRTDSVYRQRTAVGVSIRT